MATRRGPRQGARGRVAGRCPPVACRRGAAHALPGGRRPANRGGRRVDARLRGGTAALKDPGFADTLISRFGSEQIAAALDVRDGLAVGEGWRVGAPGRPVMEALDRLADAGVARFAVTAIARDGLLGGPDLALLERLVRAGRGAIVASGGIASIDDLRAVRDLGCAGAIVGSALYEGRIDLAEAVAALA
ncbi:MAG: hypothetical protein E6I94_04900 [Chloroflexi bacterium]|nr:MAG: hypothetical protein E6I94_04900 [Chloroflexota bacterium]